VAVAAASRVAHAPVEIAGAVTRVAANPVTEMAAASRE
jgi:hypothetical protein